MHSGIVRSLSTSSFDKIKVMGGHSPCEVRWCGRVFMVRWIEVGKTWKTRPGRQDLGGKTWQTGLGDKDPGEEANSMNVHQMAAQPTLRMALGDYPHTAALKTKQIKSDRVALDFADIKPVYKAFAEMVRKTA